MLYNTKYRYALTIFFQVGALLLYYRYVADDVNTHNHPVQAAESVLAYIIFFGIFVVVCTEVLSAFGVLTKQAVTLCWIFVFAMTIYWVIHHSAPLRQMRKSIYEFAVHQPCCTIGVVMIAILTLILALAVAPNTWDSMTYHMSRVMHWIQNRSVSHYDANILRQLFNPPFAEYGILHLQLLVGSDRLSNMVAWLSMWGAVLPILLLTKQLGGSHRAQTIAVLFAISIPIAVLQATSTQNDIVAAFWLLCFVYFLLYAANHKHTFRSAMLAGAALGLGLLTKYTAYFFAPPFLVWYALRREQYFLRKLAIIALVSIALTLPHWVRNYHSFGNIFAPQSRLQGGEANVEYSVKGGEANVEYSVKGTLSNIVRNSSLHLGSTTALNNKLMHGIEFIHRKIGFNPHDPRTTNSAFALKIWSTHENLAGNPIHFVLVIFTAIMLLILKNVQRKKELLAYTVCIAAGFVLFCAYLKFDPFRQRLHLPLFFLAAPLVGIVLSTLVAKRLHTYLCLFFLLLALPYTISNRSRPLLAINRMPLSVLMQDRTEQYFIARPANRESYLEAIQTIARSHCRNIGILTGGDDWEYPLWPLAQQTGKNLSFFKPTEDRQGCATIYIGRGRELLTEKDRKNAPHVVLKLHKEAYLPTPD